MLLTYQGGAESVLFILQEDYFHKHNCLSDLRLEDDGTGFKNFTSLTLRDFSSISYTVFSCDQQLVVAQSVQFHKSRTMFKKYTEITLVNSVHITRL